MLNMQIMKAISRPRLLSLIAQRFRTNPIVMLLGPRQCGKTTLARQFVSSTKGAHFFFDLEAPADAQRLRQPMSALESLKGLVVIDEAQLSPALFPVLRVLADRRPSPAKFLLLGSAAPELAGNVAESLAGRVALLPMAGFDLNEIPTKSMRALWLRGGFPRSFLASSDVASRQWRDDFIQTFLERDLRQLGVQVAPPTMRRFWMMAAHYHGQIWNASEIGRSLGDAHTTTKRHLDALCGAYVMRQLPPWFENLGKRQIKSPKVFVRDSGLLHALLGIDSFFALEMHPKLGASWEGFALDQVLRITGDRAAYFWHTQGVAELDLLLFIRGERVGVEFKYADAPTMTKSLEIARLDLKLDRVLIIYPGTMSYPLGNSCEAIAIGDLTARFMALVSPRRRLA